MATTCYFTAVQAAQSSDAGQQQVFIVPGTPLSGTYVGAFRDAVRNMTTQSREAWNIPDGADMLSVSRVAKIWLQFDGDAPKDLSQYLLELLENANKRFQNMPVLEPYQ